MEATATITLRADDGIPQLLCPFPSYILTLYNVHITLRHSCAQTVIGCLFPMPKTNVIDDILLPSSFLLSLFLYVVPSPSSSCIAPTHIHPIPQHFHLSAGVPLPLENSTPFHFLASLARAVSAPSLPTCKRHKIPLKMHRFQSLFPSYLTPYPLSIHLHVILSHSLLLSFFPHTRSSHFSALSTSICNSTSPFSKLSALNYSRVGMATKYLKYFELHFSTMKSKS